MKKNLFMLALAMIVGALAVEAQIQRGNVLVGSDIANFKLGLNKGSRFEMDINPKAAWFIRDNTAVGAYAELGLATGGGGGTAVSYGFGPVARQYLGGNALNAVRHTRFFLEGNVGIEGLNISGSGNSTNGLGLGVGPGLAYFITPNIGLEGLLKYRGRIGFGNETTSSDLNLGVGFQIYLPGRTIRNAATNTQ